VPYRLLAHLCDATTVEAVFLGQYGRGMTALEYWVDRYLLERRRYGPERAQRVLDGMLDILAEDDCEVAGVA
jgi:hypothetical protein